MEDYIGAAFHTQRKSDPHLSVIVIHQRIYLREENHETIFYGIHCGIECENIPGQRRRLGVAVTRHDPCFPCSTTPLPTSDFHHLPLQPLYPSFAASLPPPSSPLSSFSISHPLLCYPACLHAVHVQVVTCKFNNDMELLARH